MRASAPIAGSRGCHDGQGIRRALPAAGAISASGAHRYARAEMDAPAKAALMDCRGPAGSVDGNNGGRIVPHRRYRSGPRVAATAGSYPMGVASRHRLLAVRTAARSHRVSGRSRQCYSPSQPAGARGRREPHPSLHLIRLYIGGNPRGGDERTKHARLANSLRSGRLSKATSLAPAAMHRRFA